MSGTQADERLVKNEMLFRGHNERVTDNFERMVEVAEESGQDYLVKNDDAVLQFMCECSDKDCSKRIPMRPSDYRRIHKNRKHFVVLTGHVVQRIEEIISKHATYFVVKKYEMPADSGL